ncbi:hypothetical protein SAMN03159341_104230 [Paenibacillus sp. 1_12]|uniref:hypothetical protein n=1 Tax=Paenibacillus sp. 1_12 TaxID=1566278 RepID=UPI0008EE3B05|nr:hypothetical protein [Paenibacillus sp. 1_12]SFL24592.1 hypothetical protein SAMN03159341_104230 [Paenibacillus sp. 1_12]
MSYDFYYWLIMGVGFIIPNLVGVGLMWKTQKLLMSSLVSLVINLIIFVPASLWWAALFVGFPRTFGLAGYGIAFVNIEVLLLFALIIMRKKST